MSKDSLITAAPHPGEIAWQRFKETHQKNPMQALSELMANSDQISEWAAAAGRTSEINFEVTRGKTAGKPFEIKIGGHVSPN